MRSVHGCIKTISQDKNLYIHYPNCIINISSYPINAKNKLHWSFILSSWWTETEHNPRKFPFIDQAIHKAHLDCTLRVCVCYTNMVSIVVLCFFFAKMKFHYPFSSSGSVQSSATYKVSFPPQVQSHDLFGCFFPSSSCCITHAV